MGRVEHAHEYRRAGLGVTAQPLPRQSWETDADYQNRLTAWETSAGQKETPSGNSGSASEPMKGNR